MRFTSEQLSIYREAVARSAAKFRPNYSADLIEQVADALTRDLDGALSNVIEVSRFTLAELLSEVARLRSPTLPASGEEGR